MQKCPICQGEIVFFFEKGAESDTFKVAVGEKDEADINKLIKALFSYINWLNNGKKPFREGQLFHDSYHKDIQWIEGDKYSFRIQVYDSPNVDIWWRGEFRLKGNAIEVLKSEYERC